MIIDVDLMVHPYMRRFGLVWRDCFIFVETYLNYSYLINRDTDKTSEDIINDVAGLFPRLHVIVMGPGLSRDKMMLECAEGIITKAKEKDLPLIIDAVCNYNYYNFKDF